MAQRRAEPKELWWLSSGWEPGRVLCLHPPWPTSAPEPQPPTLGPCHRDVSAVSAISGSFLQATKVLREILQPTIYSVKVEAHFPLLLLVLLFQISASAQQTPEEVETLYREWQQEESIPTSPSRCSVPLLPPFPWSWSLGQGSQCDLGFALPAGLRC